MDYLLCVPNMDRVSRDTCNAVNNILARMSEKYKLRIIPEPVRIRRGTVRITARNSGFTKISENQAETVRRTF